MTRAARWWHTLWEVLPSLVVGVLLFLTGHAVADALDREEPVLAGGFAAAGLLVTGCWVFATARRQLYREQSIDSALAAELHTAVAVLLAGPWLMDPAGSVLLRIAAPDPLRRCWQIHRVTDTAVPAAFQAVAGEPAPQVVVIPVDVFVVRNRRLIRLDYTIPVRLGADGLELVDTPPLSRREIRAAIQLESRLGRRWTPPEPVVVELIGQLRRAAPKVAGTHP